MDLLIVSPTILQTGLWDNNNNIYEEKVSECRPARKKFSTCYLNLLLGLQAQILTKITWFYKRYQTPPS